MEVILRENIPSLGQIGEIVKVRPGYARNFLLPHGKAVVANPKNVKEMEHWKRATQAKLAKQKGEALALAGQIGALALTLKKEAGEGEKLFGSVGGKDIVEALRKEKIYLDKKQVWLEAPIKKLGDFEVVLKLHPEVQARLKITIEKG